MARNCRIQALRTTRAALDSNAGSSNLFAGEFYWITDEDSLAVGNAVNTYVDIGDLRADVDETVTGAWNFDAAVDISAASNPLTLTNSTNVTSVDLDVDSTGTLTVTGARVLDQSSPDRSLQMDGLGNTFYLVGDVNSPGNSQYYGTNGAGAKGFYSLPSGGIADVVDDTTPQLGGTLDANGNDIDMGPNHLICDQRIAEHDGDADTYLEFAAANSFRAIVGGVATATFGSTLLTVATNILMTGSNLICGQKIAEHFGDTNTHIDFPGLDQWSVTVGGTSMLEVGTSGVDVDGYVRNRANVIAVTASGTTAIGTTTTGNTYYDTHATGTRFYRLDSATIGTQIEVHRNGAGTVTFSQGTSQTIIQGTSVNLKDKSAMVAKCVATNTWSVVGGAA